MPLHNHDHSYNISLDNNFFSFQISFFLFQITSFNSHTNCIMCRKYIYYE